MKISTITVVDISFSILILSIAAMMLTSSLYPPIITKDVGLVKVSSLYSNILVYNLPAESTYSFIWHTTPQKYWLLPPAMILNDVVHAAEKAEELTNLTKPEYIQIDIIKGSKPNAWSFELNPYKNRVLMSILFKTTATGLSTVAVYKDSSIPYAEQLTADVRNMINWREHEYANYYNLLYNVYLSSNYFRDKNTYALRCLQELSQLKNYVAIRKAYPFLPKNEGDSGLIVIVTLYKKAY